MDPIIGLPLAILLGAGIVRIVRTIIVALENEAARAAEARRPRTRRDAAIEELEKFLEQSRGR